MTTQNRDRIGNRNGSRALALLLLVAPLVGCDVAVVAALASRSKSSSSSSGAAAPDTSFRIYVSSLGAAALDLDNEKIALDAAGGVPGAAWVLAGTGTSTQELDVTLLAGGPFTAVLIQAPEAQDYRIDALELLDTDGTTLESAAAASIRSDETLLEANAAGTPDGATADTDSLPAAKAYLFARFAAPVTLFRVTLAGTARAGGDLEFVLTLPRLGDQFSGGVAVAPSGGITLPFVDQASRNVILGRVDADGGGATITVIEADTNVTGGLPCAVVDAARDRVYVSYMRAPALTSEENLRVSRYSLATPGAATTVTDLAVLGIERVEANALALDPIGELLVAGGRPAVVGGLSPWLRKVNVADTEVWTTPTLATGTGHYFHGAAADAAGNVFAVGDTAAAGGDWQIQRYNSAGVPTPAAPRTEGDAGQDRAVAAAVDGNSLYVGGSFDRTGAGEGRNGLLFKYDAADLTPAGGAFPIEINGADDGNDEILDLAVDGGDVFVVGFTTVSSPAQGENGFVRRYSSAGALVWERSFHHGVGNDRAVSVAVGGGFVVVAAEVTIAGGSTDLQVRKYVR